MDAEVERVKGMLLAVKESWKPLREAVGPSARLVGQSYRTPEYKAFMNLELAPALIYTSPYPLQRQSNLIASVSRLFLLHLIASLSDKPTRIAALVKDFEGIKSPPD